MKEIINKRLKVISAFIDENESVIDIGCDHCLLPIYLVLNRKNIKVVGSDINEKPLNKAKDNLLKYHLEKKIELRLGNGLETVSEDINTIIISGMGGINIINILKKINNYQNINKLLLSPNNDFVYVRRELHKLGFMIINEEMVLEKGKYYLVIKAIKGKKRINLYFGKLDLKNDIVIDYYNNLYNKNREIIKKIGFIKTKKIKLIIENLYIKKKLGKNN